MLSRLDRYDIKILEFLAGDGRMTWSHLAERIGLSLTPTLKRVRALEAARYISGYHATIDEQRVGHGVSVFVSVSLATQMQDTLSRFERDVSRLPEVMSCFMMTGETDYLLRAVLPDLARYQAFISTLTRIPGVARVSSSFAVKRVIDRVAPPLAPGGPSAQVSDGA